MNAEMACSKAYPLFGYGDMTKTITEYVHVSIHKHFVNFKGVSSNPAIQTLSRTKVNTSGGRRKLLTIKKG